MPGSHSGHSAEHGCPWISAAPVNSTPTGPQGPLSPHGRARARQRLGDRDTHPGMARRPSPPPRTPPRREKPLVTERPSHPRSGDEPHRRRGDRCREEQAVLVPDRLGRTHSARGHARPGHLGMSKPPPRAGGLRPRGGEAARTLTGSRSSSLSRGEVRGVLRGPSSPHSVSEALGDSTRSRKSSLL